MGPQNSDETTVGARGQCRTRARLELALSHRSPPGCPVRHRPEKYPDVHARLGCPTRDLYLGDHLLPMDLWRPGTIRKLTKAT